MEEEAIKHETNDIKVELNIQPSSSHGDDNYISAEFLEALEKVKSRSMKLHDAAIKYQIPKTTLLQMIRDDFTKIVGGKVKVTASSETKVSKKLDGKRKIKKTSSKRAYGTKNNYSQVTLEEALTKIRSGNMTISDVAKEYKIPRCTLYHKLNNQHSKKVGRPFSGSKKAMLMKLREMKKKIKLEAKQSSETEKIKPKRKRKPPGDVTRAYGTKNNYTQAKLEEAIRKARSGTMKIGDVATEYSIPRGTLYHKLKENHSKKVGRPVTLTEAEEENIRDAAVALMVLDIPVTISDLRVMVKRYLDKEKKHVLEFKNNLPGVEWSRRFLSRHPRLKESLTLIHPLKRVHNAEINGFFDNLATKLKDVPPENIFNVDEAGFGYDLVNPHIFYRQDRYPDLTKESTKSSFTIVSCGSAKGEFLPPYFIFAGQDKCLKWIEDAPEGSNMSVSDSGWINTDIIENWLEEHFIPLVEERKGRKIIICHYISAHISKKSLELCFKYDITFVCLMPNWPYLLQPLKIGYFSKIEKHWHDTLESYFQSTKNECLSCDKFAGLARMALAHNKPSSSNDLIAGFQSTGIYPISTKALLKKTRKYFANKYIAYNLKPALDRKIEKSKSDLEDTQITKRKMVTSAFDDTENQDGVKRRYKNQNLKNSKVPISAQSHLAQNNEDELVNSSESLHIKSSPEKWKYEDFEEVEFLEDSIFALENDVESDFFNVGDFCLVNLEESILPAKIEGIYKGLVEANVLQKLTLGWCFPKRPLKISIKTEDIIRVVDSQWRNGKYIIDDKLLCDDWGV